MKLKKVKVGEALLNEGMITPAILEGALHAQKGTGRRLGKILVEMKAVSEEQIAEVLAKQLGVRFVKLRLERPNPKALFMLSEMQARKCKSVVLKDEGSSVLVGMADPTDLSAYDELHKILGKEVDVACITESDLFYVIDAFYRNSESIGEIAKELEEDIVSLIGLDEATGMTVEDAPVIKLLKGVFEDAVRSRASDIHIEPQKEDAMIRFRVDGTMSVHTRIPGKICAPLISRLKVMSGLDISERRLPQDGRFKIEAAGRSADMRLAIINGVHGEGAVIRLLRQEGGALNLADSGMPPKIDEKFRELIGMSEGMILVTGPTGSGKSTTIYAALSEINGTNKKIITIEDPVEYQLPLLNQIGVNEKIGLTFEKALRSVLRMDPDVIMVGEIRDGETAQIALRGSITGHLIFSTLHTKDALGAPTRLIDMGIPNYMVASALSGVVAQRLARRNCPNCSHSDAPHEKDLMWAMKAMGDEVAKSNFMKGAGCDLCGGTGFSGRVGIYELLVVSDELTKHLYRGDFVGFAAAGAESMKGMTMADSCASAVEDGTISLAEAIRTLN